MRFSRRQKRLAKRTDPRDLMKAYSQTEKALAGFAEAGDLRNLAKAMKDHQDIEYAKLYQQYLVGLHGHL